MLTVNGDFFLAERGKRLQDNRIKSGATYHGGPALC